MMFSEEIEKYALECLISVYELDLARLRNIWNEEQLQRHYGISGEQLNLHLEVEGYWRLSQIAKLKYVARDIQTLKGFSSDEVARCAVCLVVEDKFWDVFSKYYDQLGDPELYCNTRINGLKDLYDVWVAKQ